MTSYGIGDDVYCGQKQNYGQTTQMEVVMKKIFAVAFIIAGMTCFAHDAQPKKQASSIMAENRRIATTLPTRVIDPQTYQDTNVPIRYVDTRSLVQRGYKILEYNNGKPNSLGYTLHYDPSLHRDVYMRIPKSGKDIYGNHW